MPVFIPGTRSFLEKVCVILLLPAVLVCGHARAGGGYADSAWPAIHADSRNSNSMPYAAPVTTVTRWSTLTSASVASGPVIDEAGYLWVTTGQGPGTSCLHRLDKDGNTVWESPPYWNDDDLDSMALMGSPRIDDEGTVYVTDGDQLWAFHPDPSNPRRVQLKWVTSLPPSTWPGGAQYAVFFLDDLVGIFALPGTVVLYDRDFGTPATPLLELPGELSTLDDAANTHNLEIIVESMEQSGLIDPTVVSKLLGLDTGTKWVLTNAPAVHPETGDIFISGAGALTPDGHGTSTFYVVRLNGSGTDLELVHEAPLGTGSRASSPGVLPDGSRLIIIGDDSTIHAFDAHTYQELWTIEQSEARGTSAPTIGFDGTLFYNGVDDLAAFDPDGHELWRRDFNDLAEAWLDPVFPFRDPSKSSWDPMFTNERFAILMHVFGASAEHVWVAPVMGYGIDENPLDDHDQLVPTPEISVIMPLDPRTGEIDGSITTLPEVADGHIVLDKDGSLYVTHMGALSAVVHYGLDDVIPTALKVDAPIGGITALEPGLYKAHVAGGTEWTTELIDQAQASLEQFMLGGGQEKVDKARATIELAADQVDALASALVSDHADGELCPFQVDAVEQYLVGDGQAGGAAGELRAAADLLQSSSSNITAALSHLESAETLLTDAAGTIPVQPEVTITAENGARVTIRGKERRVDYGVQDEEFLDIPYAEPPTGDLRWRRPVPKQWADGTVIDATEFGPNCPQCDGGGDSTRVTGSENCLTLNIFRPKAEYCSDGPQPRLPVMAYIHGGGFISGSADIYNGFRLATAGNVIVVTLQYRLGVLGFLSLPELQDEDPGRSTGNYGHLDVLQALKWIQDHIADFGGDPDNVTLFGQSAGAGITCSVLATPLKHDLYGVDLLQRAIMQSGFCAAALELGSEDSTDVDTAIYRSKLVIDNVESCTAECYDPETRLEALRDLPPEDITLAMCKTSSDTDQPFYTFPAIDGYYLDVVPAKALISGAARNMPVITGDVEDEGSLLAAPYYLPITTWPEFKKQVTKVVGARWAKQVVVPLYKRQFDDPQVAYQVLWEDFVFMCPMVRNANDIRNAGSQVYTYLFRADPHSEDFSFGAFHGLDVYYVWDYWEIIEDNIGPLGEGDFDLIDIMQTAWTSFAWNGTPTLTPAWPTSNDAMVVFDVQGQSRENAVVDVISATSKAYRGGRCEELWPVFASIDNNGDDLPDVDIFRTLKPATR